MPHNLRKQTFCPSFQLCCTDNLWKLTSCPVSCAALMTPENRLFLSVITSSMIHGLWIQTCLFVLQLNAAWYCQTCTSIYIWSSPPWPWCRFGLLVSAAYISLSVARVPGVWNWEHQDGRLRQAERGRGSALWSVHVALGWRTTSVERDCRDESWGSKMAGNCHLPIGCDWIIDPDHATSDSSTHKEEYRKYAPPTPPSLLQYGGKNRLCLIDAVLQESFIWPANTVGRKNSDLHFCQSRKKHVP